MIRRSGSTSSAPFARSAIRWWTPNRCCSSTIASPSRWNATPSWISACVPMSIVARPLAASSSARSRALPVTADVSSSTPKPSPKRRPVLGRRRVGERLQEAPDGEEMLLRQHLGRRHERGLRAGSGGDRAQRPPRRPSCRFRPHPGGAGASAAARPCRRRSPRSPGAARRSAGTAAIQGSARRAPLRPPCASPRTSRSNRCLRTARPASRTNSSSNASLRFART